MSDKSRVTRERLSVKDGETSTETVYLITSLAEERADPKRLLALNRGHWAIEKRLHWVRDVTFDEDRSQVRTRQGPRLSWPPYAISPSARRTSPPNSVSWPQSRIKYCVSLACRSQSD